MEENEIELKNNSIIHKNKSLTRLDLSFLKHIELSEYKKSNLLAYWIHDYAVYHDEEKDKENDKLNNLLKELEKLDDIPENIQNVIKLEQKYIDKMNKEISKMKQDSIALIDTHIVKYFPKLYEYTGVKSPG